MTDSSEVLDQALAELPFNGRRSTDGLLEVINQQWLERTSGDVQTIVSGLTREVNSGQPDSDLCESLLAGQIVRVAREHMDEGRDELTLYKTGQQAVKSYIATVSDSPEGPRLMKATSAIEAAFAEGPSNDALPQPSFPRIRRFRSNPDQETLSDYRPRTSNVMEALNIANQKLRRIHSIRAGLRSGELSLGQVLGDSALSRVPISNILVQVPKVGPTKTRNILKANGLAPETEIGALTEDEKNALVLQLPSTTQTVRKNPVSSRNKDQIMRSLNRANEVRLYRANMKLRLCIRAVSVEELFEDKIALGMKLGEVLTSLPIRKPTTQPSPATLRKRRATRLRDSVLAEVKIPGDKRLNELTPRQQQKVLDALAARDRGYTYFSPYKS